MKTVQEIADLVGGRLHGDGALEIRTVGSLDRATRGVLAYAEGKHLTSYPRHTACRRLIDQDCYEGKATDRVEAPTRLGKIGQRIVLPRSWDWEAPRRGVDRYALLVEQAGRQA